MKQHRQPLQPISSFFSKVSPQMHMKKVELDNLKFEELKSAKRTKTEHGFSSFSSVSPILKTSSSSSAILNHLTSTSSSQTSSLPSKSFFPLTSGCSSSTASIEEDIVQAVEGMLEPRIVKHRPYSHRPPNFKDIVTAFDQYGYSAMNDYSDCFESMEKGRITQKIKRWRQSILLEVNPTKRAPAYGQVIDDMVYQSILGQIDHGAPVNNITLRAVLIVELTKHNKLDLLVENGGQCIFRESWAKRFWKRHNLSSRVITTKLRELPSDFEERKVVFSDIGGSILLQNDIPPDLVLNCDETAVLFNPRPKKTRARKGEKRIRAAGVGNEKPQITVTIFCSESGNILSSQLIFKGKTDRCHPVVQKPPPGIIYDHSQSHWQTPSTFISVLEKIVIPYRKKIIKTSKLLATQKMMLILDLHYSHFDPTVLIFMQKNHIIPLYIPGRCTDKLQVCDVVINRPFKQALRLEFVLYIQETLEKHLKSGSVEPWVPNSSESTLH